MRNETIKLYEVFKAEYLRNGYMYSGCMEYSYIRSLGFSKESITELVESELIEKRNCEAYSYELTNEERKKLIQENNLSAVWENDKTARVFYPNSLVYTGEVAMVMQ
jgi:glutamyl/glutaminyl-tRNA synthetase